MPRPEIQKFNKEKLVFLLASAVCAIGLYLFMAWWPETLVAGKPVGTQPQPAALDSLNLDKQGYIEDYFQGKRKTPFTPAAYKNPNAPKNQPRGLPPPPPPPPPPQDPEKKPQALTFDAKDLNVQVAFGGTVMRPGEPAIALLRSKADSTMLCKKVGDTFTVGGCQYTITQIEQQSIWLTDADGNPFILNDGGLSGEEVVVASPGTTPAPAPTPPSKVTPPPPKRNNPSNQPKSGNPANPTKPSRKPQPKN